MILDELLKIRELFRMVLICFSLPLLVNSMQSSAPLDL